MTDTTHWHWRERALAAERTVREQREAIERLERLADRYESMGQLTVAEFIRVALSPPVPIALAALAPDTEVWGWEG